MRLFICEKPSQAANLAPIIGAIYKKDGFSQNKDGSTLVTWCVGHLLELANPEAYDENYKKWNLNHLPIIPDKWILNVKSTTKKQYKVIRDLIKKTSEVVIATDIDREGDTIAWELLELFKWNGKTSRLWSSSNNKDGLIKALNNIKDSKQSYRMYQAGKGRAQADWLIGMNFTRLYTTLAKQSGFTGKVLSIGRVQTPLLNLIVMRDRSIKNFIPQKHFGITVQLNKNNSRFKATWIPKPDDCDDNNRCLNLQLAKTVMSKIKNCNFIVDSIEAKRHKIVNPLCFSLSELQQRCNNLYGMDMEEVLQIAQSLYETHKATTYPRTDCGYLQNEMFDEVGPTIKSLLQSDPAIKDIVSKLDFSIKSRVWDNSKITAHHGIIPTTEKIDLSKLSTNEIKVYELIRLYYLAQFLPVCEIDKTVIKFNADNAKSEIFISRGSKVVNMGWKQLFINTNQLDDNDDELDRQTLPLITKQDICKVIDAELNEKVTTPPKPFNDATLLDAMINVARYVTDPNLKKLLRENSGLGTEATRPSILKTLYDRGYIEKKKKNIISTTVGQSLIDSLPKIITDPGMTALWEQELKDIELGNKDLSEFINKQKVFIKLIIDNAIKDNSVTIKQITKNCPECGSPMIKRKGKSGEFFGCSKYPDCKSIVNIKRKAIKKVEN